MKLARQKELIAKNKIVADPDGYLVDIEKYYVKPGEVPWWRITGLIQRRKTRARQGARMCDNTAGLRLYHRKLKLNVIALFGGKCARCGETDPRVLQINHINGNGKEDRETYANSYSLYGAILSGERPIDDLSLLCANCNTIHEWVIGRRKNLSNKRIRVIRILGGVCKECRQDNPLALQINHIVGNSRGDVERYGGNINLYRAIISGDRPTAGLNLLCANCNIRYEYEIGRRHPWAG